MTKISPHPKKSRGLEDWRFGSSRQVPTRPPLCMPGIFNESQILSPCQLRWRDAMDIFDILRQRRDNSTCKLVSVPHGFACGIIPNSLWLLDNSSNKFHFATLLKFGTHYN